MIILKYKSDYVPTVHHTPPSSVCSCKQYTIQAPYVSLLMPWDLSPFKETTASSLSSPFTPHFLHFTLTTSVFCPFSESPRLIAILGTSQVLFLLLGKLIPKCLYLGLNLDTPDPL